MSLSNRDRSKSPGRHAGAPSSVDEAARAKRARDHLARKRRYERERLERERGRAAGAGSRARLRSVVAPILFLLAFAVGIASAVPLAEVFVYRSVRLDRVAIQGTSVVPPLAIAQAVSALTGRPLDTIDPDEIRAAMTSDPWIESARALRLPSGTLVISVVERAAVARWRMDDASEMELIDRDGKRFAGSTDRGGPLPLVRGKIAFGESIPPSAIEILDEVQRYVRLAGDPSQLTLQLPELHATSAMGPRHVESGYVLQIGEEGPRALLGDRLFVQRIARLAALLESEAPTLKDARWIDLRYADRAVLRTEPASG